MKGAHIFRAGIAALLLAFPCIAADSVNTQHGLSQKQVRQLQKTLNQAGFQAGKVDGIYGPQTAGALRAFQQAQGVVATGEPDTLTLAALGIQSGGNQMAGRAGGG